MGEMDIIINLAKDYKAKGDSNLNACKNAITTYNLALKQALEYEYKPSRRGYKVVRRS